MNPIADAFISECLAGTHGPERQAAANRALDIAMVRRFVTDSDRIARIIRDGGELDVLPQEWAAFRRRRAAGNAYVAQLRTAST